ncbi:MAG TPA: DUF4910 domain-containing protein [Bacteroidales bacterium]|nr:DUF4910 domain-containing protein [Bacteroidales bacterium]
MKKSIVINFAFLIYFCIPCIGQTSLADTSYLKYCVETLASDSMGGRKPGTKYDLKAANFIAGQFEAFKIKPLKKNNYFQEFDYSYDSCLYTTRNVVAFINNRSKENVIIAAHYDHLGFGGKRSRSYGKHEVHNGADDNASGVALMLGLAHQLKKKNSKKYNYIFVAFSGHEDGLFGSSFFVKSNIVDSNSVKLMINLDMVGRADAEQPTVFIASNDTSLQVKATNIIDNSLLIKPKDLPIGDHSAFEKFHIPVLFFTTGTHDDYHKTSDDTRHINYWGMAHIEDYILRNCF